MTVYITELHGMDNGTATNAINQVAKLGGELGFQPMSMFAYPVNSDSDSELSKRLDGILASFTYNDILILQVPTWMDDMKYEMRLLDKVDLFRQVSNTKIIMFIEDIMPLFWGGNDHLAGQIQEFNRADALIVANHNTEKKLRELGCTVDKYIYQEVWDNPTSLDLNDLPEYHPLVNFAGSIDKFKFVNDWSSSDVPLNLFGNHQPKDNPNVHYQGWVDNDMIAYRLHQAGGFGLMWESSQAWYEYMKINTSYKFGTYITAGLPVIVHRGVAQEELVNKYKLGIVADSLDDAVAQVQRADADQYRQWATNVQRMAQLTRHGMFAKQAMEQAVFEVMLPEHK